MNPKNSLGKEYESLLNKEGIKLAKDFYTSEEFRHIESERDKQYQSIADIQIVYSTKIAALQKLINNLKVESYRKSKEYRDRIEEINHVEIGKIKHEYVRKHLNEYKERLRQELNNDSSAK